MFIRPGMIAAAVIGLLSIAPPISLHDAFNSQQAYAYTAEVAGFGERWPGSPGHKKTEGLIHQVLQKDGAQIETDDFTATTPRGPVAVHNIIGKFNASADPKQDIFILAGHYDTLFKPGFIGATMARQARRFYWRLPILSLTKKRECKSGWSGPTWRRRFILSEETMASTEAVIWPRSWRPTEWSPGFAVCFFST